jgi:uncharacterized cupin superfamily protein
MPANSRALIEVANTASNMTPSPIENSWIIEGNPVAQSSLLSKSADGQAWTVVWQCSEGKFHWYYDIDETVLLLQGSIVIETDGMLPTRYGPDDVIFFPEQSFICRCRLSDPASPMSSVGVASSACATLSLSEITSDIFSSNRSSEIIRLDDLPSFCCFKLILG